MLDAYWETQTKCLDEIAANGDSAGAVIAILNRYYAPSSAEAFFPGGGDRDLLEALMGERSDWEYAWSEASYHYALTHPGSNSGFTYVEGDIYRGTQR